MIEHNLKHPEIILLILKEMIQGKNWVRRLRQGCETQDADHTRR